MTPSIDVLLINAPWGGLVSARSRRYNRSWQPLDLLNCAALLKDAGFSVRLADARARAYSIDQLKRMASNARLIVVNSSPLDRWQCPNLELDEFLQFAKGLCRRDAVICGVHGTVMPRRVLEGSGAGAVIVGEPEAVVVQLARSGISPLTPGLAWLEDGELVTSSGPGKVDVARLPIPAFDLAPTQHYGYELMGGRMAILETARGCHRACAFCLKAMYGQGVRFKSINQVMAEVDAACRAGAERAYFIDLDFTADTDRALELCRALKQADTGLEWCVQARVDAVDRKLLQAMSGAGCRLVHYGVESAAAEALKQSAKPINQDMARRAVEMTRQAGIASACFFLFGLPGETASGRRATVALAKSLGAEYCSFHQVTPYPGTLLQARTGGDPFAPGWPGSDSLAGDLRQAYLSYYLRPSQVWRMLRAGGAAGIARGLRLLGGFIG